jgi:hypothetical protein
MNTSTSIFWLHGQPSSGGLTAASFWDDRKFCDPFCGFQPVETIRKAGQKNMTRRKMDELRLRPKKK